MVLLLHFLLVKHTLSVRRPLFPWFVAVVVDDDVVVVDCCCCCWLLLILILLMFQGGHNFQVTTNVFNVIPQDPSIVSALNSGCACGGTWSNYVPRNIFGC